MADVDINKFRASVVREGSKPASPGFIVSEGQSPTDPAGSGQNHLPVTIAEAATGLSITESQVLGGAGTVGQYIRGDGSLADFPESSGGGSSVSYYLNGSVSQGTIGGVAYKELNKVPILGVGTDFTINADGYIASFLTDAGDPNLLEIPGGNWNFETYFSASSSGGTPTFYVELYKYDGSTFTLIASSVSAPEFIAFGTTLTPYFSSLAVPTTTLALTDRLAVRYYVTHSGRTITLHTENNHLCQIITTFTTGITALNGLTAQVQNFAVGTSGTDFAIASATATHTFNLPTASAINRGALSSADWTTFNSKQNALTNPVTGTGASGQVAYFNGTTAISSGSNFAFNSSESNLTIQRATSTLGNAITISKLSDADQAWLAFRQGGGSTGTWRLGYTGSAYDFTINAGSDASIGTEAMRIFTGGNVHIGPTPASNNGARLQVSGTARANGISSIGQEQAFTWQRTTGTASDVYSLNADSGSAYLYNNTTANILMLWSEGGNVGIGTASPPSRLSVQWDKSTVFAGSAVYDSQAFNTSNHGGTLAFGGTFNSGGSYTEWSAIGGMKSNTTDGNVSGDINFYTRLNSSAMTQRMVITSSGNVGIGVTPSAWSVVVPAIQIGDRGGYVAAQNGTNVLRFGSNHYFNGSNFIYTTTDRASYFETGEGQFKWFQASSGTAGNTVTFSQPMTLTTSGNLLIGPITDIGERLTLNGRIGIVGSTVASGNTRSFFVRGAQTVADGGTLTLSVTNTALIFIAENNTGTGALFFCGYASATIVKISDPSNMFDVADTAGKLCIFKSAVTDVATVKNRLGSSKSITVTYIGVSD